jgi:hypothetical protein
MRFHEETTGVLSAPPTQVFDHLDDPRRLSAHMSRSSAMMIGSRMDIELDAAEGRAVGSRIRLHGRVLGIPLILDEVVVERIPPVRKVWQMIGAPQLLVLSRYTMGYQIAPDGSASLMRVFIDYGLPTRGLARRLGWLFGRSYARWCTREMVKDAARHFDRLVSSERGGPR